MGRQTESSLPDLRLGSGPRDDARALSGEKRQLAFEGLGEINDAFLRLSGDAVHYQIDFWERSILYWDTLRQRADNMIAHERAGKPPLLDFDYEMLLDARRFDRPVSYALLRITRSGDACFDRCVDPSKPPVILLDPRAGHGPGIGGMKRDSEIGMALHEGRPAYFVTFFPEPCPGQTLADVLHALRRFAEQVAERHPGKPPVLYGNCQAGWAVALLSADCEGFVGPAVLNGSPLSYWAGEEGVNPMRLAGGLVGGAWLPHFLSDLGDGRFDGAWLVQNFENLRPEAVWQKYANLFVHIDSERDRFLAFERWWSGFYFLGRDEILAIVENLFIGNQIERGKFRVCDCCYADFHRIRNPLIVFASHGDNITPPHQALGWISAVYKTTEDLERSGQRIVYLTNPHIGHLGIFVSAKVARLEHRAILESLAEIETLPAGLYEMKIHNPTGDRDCRKPQFQVSFERRKVSDIRYPAPTLDFDFARRVSETNELLYASFVSPLIQAMATPWSAAMLEWLHPMRTSRYLLSEEFCPWMPGIREFARVVEDQRSGPLPEDNFFCKMERGWIEFVSKSLEASHNARDAFQEQAFALLYGKAPPTER